MHICDQYHISFEYLVTFHPNIAFRQGGSTMRIRIQGENVNLLYKWFFCTWNINLSLNWHLNLVLFPLNLYASLATFQCMRKKLIWRFEFYNDFLRIRIYHNGWFEFSAGTSFTTPRCAYIIDVLSTQATHWWTYNYAQRLVRSTIGRCILVRNFKRYQHSCVHRKGSNCIGRYRYDHKIRFPKLPDGIRKITVVLWNTWLCKTFWHMGA